MAKGNKKYVDPSGVLNSIVDDFGQRVQIGEEKDIREFNDVLLSRISDAIKAKTKLLELGEKLGEDGSNPMAPEDEPMTSSEAPAEHLGL
jgi:hypothetical protein